MISINNKKNCCGCNACGDICQNNSISYIYDNEGFWYPQVNKETCINCNLCNKVCPIENIHILKSKSNNNPIVYGGYNKNITVRFDSTSGGIFSVFANEIYKSNGYVSGAIFNEDFSVSNFISNNKNDLSKLRGSKYVQSNAQNLYKTIKYLLDSGQKILACGSPCQMAALRTYLGKDYNNLIIVDFLCRAANSPKVYKKYLNYLESIYNSKIIYIKAKNKDHGWRSLARKVIFENNQIYYGEGEIDYYRKGYHNNCFERPSCYDCKFKEIPRYSDITLGDFWGIENIDKSLDKDLGTSVIMLNTEKGKVFFEKVKNKIEYKQFTIKDIIKYNKIALIKPINYPTNIDREKMFKDLDLLSFDKIAEKYFTFKDKKSNFKINLKKMIKNLFNLLKNPFNCLRILKYNLFRKNTISNILKGNYIKILSHCAIDLHKTSKIIINNGIFSFGVKKNKKSKMETRLLLEKGATLQIDGDNFIKNGSDIQIFENAILRFGKGCTNQGLQIVCADKILIGDNVHIGRDVWIRDNNGGHSIIISGYKDKAPIIIEDYCWICSNVTIMKGVTIGEGSIISANSVVTSNIPPHCLAAGNPAKIIAKDIKWLP